MNRHQSIDFLRGFALVAILVDHMPRSLLAGATPRNFALFDATELFVFLSGLSVAIVWGKAVARGNVRNASVRLVRRAGLLYLAYVATAAALLSVGLGLSHAGLGYSAIWTGYPLALGTDPIGTMLAVATLRMQPNLVDVLLLYVALLAVSPIIVEAVRRSPLAAGTVSAVAWWFATPLNALLPGDAHAGPLFNPFAWQAVFALGAAAWFHGHRLRAVHPRLRATASSAAAAILLFGMVVLHPSWFGLDVAPFGLTAGDFGKWAVHPVRLASFASAAWLFAELAPSNAAGVWRSVPATALARVGRNGLACFCAGTVLSLLFDAHARAFGGTGGALSADFGAVATLILLSIAVEGRATATRWTGMSHGTVR